MTHAIHTTIVCAQKWHDWITHHCFSGSHQLPSSRWDSIPMLWVWVFSLLDTKSKGQSCIVFPTLALLADRRETVQWWSLWAHASFYHLQMIAVLVPWPWSCPCPLQPSLCYIQRPPLLQLLNVTAEDNSFKQRCRLVSKLWQQLPSNFGKIITIFL